MNEPMTGAERPNGHRRAEEAILAATEKGVPLLPHCVSYEFFLQRRKDNPEFESAIARACRRRRGLIERGDRTPLSDK
jgi:hypothetical protein